MDSAHRVRAILSFVHAADAGSFAAAGRSLGLTAAAVSKNVATLEKALGVRLMNRTTRALNLTEEGAAFLAQARVAMEALDAAVDTVAAQRVAPTGRVRISTSLAFGREQLMPTLPGLLSRYPGLVVDVDFDDHLVDLVAAGYDLAVRGGNIRDSALVSRSVCRLNLVVIASPGYLREHGAPRSVEALARHRVIARRFLGGRVGVWNFRSADGGAETFDPAGAAVMTLSEPEAVIQAARAGVGIAQVAVHLAWRELAAGALKVVLHEQHDPGPYEMVIQYPHRALLAPRVRATVDYLLDAFARDESLHVPIGSLREYVFVS
jgi:DNA-binding transcriptional LysR family regulator